MFEISFLVSFLIFEQKLSSLFFFLEIALFCSFGSHFVSRSLGNTLWQSTLNLALISVYLKSDRLFIRLLNSIKNLAPKVSWYSWYSSLKRLILSNENVSLM